jgi:hypothetical protein
MVAEQPDARIHPGVSHDVGEREATVVRAELGEHRRFDLRGVGVFGDAPATSS